MPSTHSKALNLLQSIFGYEQFRGAQEEIIDRLIKGKDAMVLMPTGGGKSLCYQIPAIIREGVGIVISPLIALMQDQVTALKQNGVKAACLNSSLTVEDMKSVEAALLKGELDLLYVAPERLFNEYTLRLFRKIKIALFAIDEAHCVSQWGHDFRPDYIQLSMLSETFPAVPRIALTATADGPTQNEIIMRLSLQNAKLFNSGFDRPNIRYRISESSGKAREQLFHFIQAEHENEAGIVYCLSRKRVEEIAEWLTKKGITALPYHAGLSANTRRQHQQRFLMDDGIIIVATIAFGMGIDKPDVRFVAHMNLPKSIEAYYQETGRAGRDGAAANAWMAYGLQDVITLRKMQETSGADEQHKRVERHKLDSMLGLCELTTCRRQTLLRYFGDDLEEPCGNCDNCISPPQTWDATIAAQKALSCVHRTGQRFGVNYLIDVLRSSNNERIKQFGHEKISTYGIGIDLSSSEWRGIYRQLISRNLVGVDLEGFGGLHLNKAALPVLQGKEALFFRKLTKPTKARRAGKNKPFNQGNDSLLWNALRDCRRALAKKQGVPTYVIFHDVTLAEMVEKQPRTAEQFSLLSGVGRKKLAAYGNEFISIIMQYSKSVTADDTAQKRRVTLNTV